MSKPTLNYWIDLVIGAAFIASALSGIVFLLPFSGESALGLSYATWDTIHTWGSLLMIGGVLAHLALHWKWLTHMTRKTLLPAGQPAAQPAVRRAGAPVAADTGRREFLRLAGSTAVVAGVAIAGYELLGAVRNSAAGESITATGTAATAVEPATAVQSTTTATAAEATPAASEPLAAAPAATTTPVTIPLTPTATPEPVVQTSQVTTVACRKGQVNCPFPGRCHSYRDTNGNGYCDLSQPA